MRRARVLQALPPAPSKAEPRRLLVPRALKQVPANRRRTNRRWSKKPSPKHVLLNGRHSSRPQARARPKIQAGSNRERKATAFFEIVKKPTLVGFFTPRLWQPQSYLGRARVKPLSGWDKVPARSCCTALATALATLRTSACIGKSVSSASWLVAYGS